MTTIEDINVPVTWVLEPYVPTAMEFDTLFQWRHALRTDRWAALRLTKLAHTGIAQASAKLPVATFRVPVDQVELYDQVCCICHSRIKNAHKTAIATTGLAFHKACLPSPLRLGETEQLLMFSEEIEQKRTISSVLQTMSLQRGR